MYLASGLIAAGHGHLLSYWAPLGTNDALKREFMAMVLLSIKYASRDLEKFRIALIQPPVSQKNPYYMPAHDDVRDDPYYW